MRGKAIWSIIGVIVIGLIIYFAVGAAPTDTGDGEPVSTESEFETKVVYTTEMSVDSEPLEADCELRGGTFNECGTICAPDAAACAQVCAYTCDDITPGEGVMDTDTSTSSATSTDEMSTSSATSTN